MSLGLTGCNNKKAKTKTLPPANSQPAAPAPKAKPTKAPVAKAKAKPKTPAQPVVNKQAVFNKKINVYIKCYNKLQIPVQRSLARYANWLKNFKQGPTGKKRTVYGIYGISKSNLAKCKKGVKSAVALTPALQPINGVAVSYINAAVALNNTINKINKYYTQKNYKNNAFAKKKTLHQTFLKNLKAFKPVAKSYHAAIQKINNKRQLAKLKNIKKKKKKTFHYYSLAVIISAKQINNLISQNKFNAKATIKKVSKLKTLVTQTKKANKNNINFSFINSANQYQLKAKKYVRRIKNKVPYSN